MEENKIYKIRLYLEYGQEPVWLYDREGAVIDVGLPPEWTDDKNLYQAMMELSDVYDALFVNDDMTFEYVGFETEAQKEKIEKLADDFVKMIIAKNDNRYTIQNDLKF